jgi:alpha-ketoglutarate-dependent taurine dioxygenase
MEHRLPQWSSEAAAVLNVLRGFHNGAAYQAVGPLPSQAATEALRRALLQCAPSFAGFVDELQRRLRGKCGIFIPRLGLGELPVDDRAMLVYAIGLCVGEPTATDTRQVIWDVQARRQEAGYYSTFSETDLEAAFHSDTQYYPMPEQAFILYTMEEARCGGGWSQVCDARALRLDLERHDRWVSDALTTCLLPFRVPSAFMTTKVPGMIQATIAPVLGETPYIRYRFDTLDDGLKHFPEYGTADALRAIDVFEERLAACEHSAEFFMSRDSLMLLDNHHALHARTGFTDHARHLLRIRLRVPSLATSSTTPVQAYEMVTRHQSRRAAAPVSV